MFFTVKYLTTYIGFLHTILKSATLENNVNHHLYREAQIGNNQRRNWKNSQWIQKGKYRAKLICLITLDKEIKNFARFNIEPNKST